MKSNETENRNQKKKAMRTRMLTANLLNIMVEIIEPLI